MVVQISQQHHFILAREGRIVNRHTIDNATFVLTYIDISGVAPGERSYQRIGRILPSKSIRYCSNTIHRVVVVQLPPEESPSAPIRSYEEMIAEQREEAATALQEHYIREVERMVAEEEAATATYPVATEAPSLARPPVPTPGPASRPSNAATQTAMSIQNTDPFNFFVSAGEFVYKC